MALEGKFIQLAQLETFLTKVKAWAEGLFLKTANAAAVATSGAAADVSVADAGNHFTGTNVEAVLAELAGMIGSGDVDFEKLTTPTTGKLATYRFTKGDPQNGGKTMDIDIEKDLMNDTLELVTITEVDGHYYDGSTEVTSADGVTSAGVYMKYNTAPSGDTPVYKYANMAGVIEYITVPTDQSTAMVVLTLDANHVLSASLRDGSITATKLAAAVQTSLAKADSAYQKPQAGIPSTDMTSAVQTSLAKADTAYQLPQNGMPSTDMTSAVQTSLGKADTALQSADIVIANDTDINNLFTTTVAP